MEEIWKDIQGYEGLYMVSNLGRVKSLNYHREHREKIIKPIVRRGYYMIRLSKDGKRRQFGIHRLVAIAFVEGYFEDAVVNHIDENKQNNVWTNLEWVTQQENVQHSSYKQKGKTHSEETKRKISEAMKGKTHSEETRRKMSNKVRKKKVRCIETGEIFNSLNEAGDRYHRNYTNIVQAIKRNGTCAGYHWELVS